ncbi:MAG: nitroreductase family protein [Treponema sp.]|nr:nitroreductase family protein [Treponema sp.]
MDFLELVKKSRTYRRFDESKKLSKEQLETLVEYACFTPSGANKMPLKYITVTDEKVKSIIFKNVGWAAYLPDWDGPKDGEKPTGYIIMLRDTDISKNTATDEGIQAQTIMLGAANIGLGGCIMGNIKRPELAKELGIDEKYEIALVLALGVPCEKVVIEPMDSEGNIKYWHDENNVNHVPKRALPELLIKEL